MPADMGQFFDFGEAAIPEGMGVQADKVLIQTSGMVCPAHGPDSTERLVIAFLSSQCAFLPQCSFTPVLFYCLTPMTNCSDTGQVKTIKDPLPESQLMHCSLLLHATPLIKPYLIST